MPDRAEATLQGTVENVVKSRYPGECEKAEITVEGADHLYKEIRIENTFTQKSGHEVHLKPGAEVKLTVEAGPEAFRPEE
jgi:hypothetical protein